MKEKKIPFKKALIWILLVTLLITGSAIFFTLCYFQVKELRLSHTGFNIYELEQKEKEGRDLPTNYLAYLLNLSIDKPTNLYQFDRSLAQSKLLSSSIIAECDIIKSPPNALKVEYTLRKPYAKIADYANTAIDRMGNLFPYEPFFKNLNVLEIVLGVQESSIKWGEKVDKNRVEIAFDICNILKNISNVRRIDLSKVDADSLGQREIVVIIEEKNGLFQILRLAPKNFSSQLKNFLRIKEYQKEIAEHNIIDLRISDLAFISTTNH